MLGSKTLVPCSETEAYFVKKSYASGSFSSFLLEISIGKSILQVDAEGNSNATSGRHKGHTRSLYDSIHVEDLNTVGKKKTKYGNNEDNTIPSSTCVTTFDGPHEQI